MTGKVYCSEECRLLDASITTRLDDLEGAMIDHAQRFDTLQTPFWKRLWFWVDGWPWYDLNGEQRKRLWHRDR